MEKRQNWEKDEEESVDHEADKSGSDGHEYGHLIGQKKLHDQGVWTPSIALQESNKLHKQLVSEFPDVFANRLPNKLPPENVPKHRILLKDEKKSINGRPFRIPSVYLDQMSEFIKEHLESGRIRPSSSNMSAGTWMVPKNNKTRNDPTAKRRVVHDFRALNDNTIKDYTPLPRQDEIMTQASKGKIRGKIDLLSAYYQMAMHPDDIHKTAFKTPFGMYEWLVMPQGLCNAPASFQRYMNHILHPYIGKFCNVYLDDIIFWSNSIKEHYSNARTILTALQEHGIIASADKSCLFADAVAFLGHIISSRGIEVAQDKVEKIQGWPIPTSAQEIKEFNGLVNYIGQFIPGLAQWSTVLSGLTRKGVEFNWKSKHQDAFDNIKRLAKNTPVCKPIDYKDPNPIYVVADASNRAIGGYFGQGKDFKTMKPAAFHSRSLNEAERNYPTHDKEMLAIVDCLKKWEAELTGTRFEILTDHAPLQHWKTQKDLSDRQIRWNELLSRFDMDIRYIPGISNSAADALSRYPYVQQNIAVPIKEEYIDELSTFELDDKVLNSIREHCPSDNLFGPVIESPDQYPLYDIVDGLIYFEGRLAIPSNDRGTRNTLMELHHDKSNHFGQTKTIKSITRELYWPGVAADVETYIKSCTSCAQNKSSTQRPAGLLHPMPIPTKRFEEIAMDFVGPLPKSHGYDTMLVITDRLTNYVKIEPCKSTNTAVEIADIVYRSWCRQFGLPNAITCDRDKLFTSKFWKELFKKLDVQLRMSTAFHPETDGSSERSNKTIIESLRHYVNTRQTDWTDHLVHVELAMNNSTNATTGKTPTELLYGTTIRQFPSLTKESDIPAVNEFIERIEQFTATARDNHAEAKTRQTTNANRHRRKEPEYSVGDKVYLDTTNMRLKVKQKGRAAKLYPRSIGPFEITHANPRTSTYKLDLPPEYSEIHPTFHAKRLKAAFDNDDTLFPNRQLSRPPPVFEQTDEYEIELIKDHRDTRRGRQYLVHWLGYPNTDDEWIHEGNISAKDLIKDYLDGLDNERSVTR